LNNHKKTTSRRINKENAMISAIYEGEKGGDKGDKGDKGDTGKKGDNLGY
jgi:hypothetical protein